MNPATSPIYLGGCSASGKTPLRIILSGHPDVSLTRKTDLWGRYYGRFGDLRAAPALERCLRALASDPGVAQLAPDPAAIRDELADASPTYARLFGVVHRQAAARAGRSRWGEQLGFVERYADPIFADFPDARMVHLVRDERARTSTALGGARPRPGRRGWEAAKWRCSTDLAARNRVEHPDGYSVVSYEALVADTQATVRAVCAFVGLDFVAEISDRADAFAGTQRSGPPVDRPDGPHRPDRAGHRRAVDRIGMTAWQLFERRRAARIGR